MIAEALEPTGIGFSQSGVTRDSGVPFTVVIAPDGKLLYQEGGEVNILKLRRTILANLPDPDYIG